MQQRTVGASGLRVSRFGLGTLGWGAEADVHEARDQLGVFRDAGGTLLDTAGVFGGGAAEEVLGALLRDHDRDELVVTTASGSSRDASARVLLAQLDASLRRLGTDHVDVWFTAGWDPAVPLDETLRALTVATTSGRARYGGVTGHCGWQLAVVATAAQRERIPLVATQVEHSLVERAAADEVVPAANHLGVGVFACSPLGRGVLTGKYRDGVPRHSRARTGQSAAPVEPYLQGASRRVVAAVATAADGLGVQPLHVALAWARDAPGVTASLMGARTVDQLRSALDCEALVLPAEIREALDDVSAASAA